MSSSHSPAPDSELPCPECDYNLTGAAGDRCPWCGWAIDVDTLLRSGRSNPWTHRWGTFAAAVTLGGGSLLAIALMISKGRRLNLFDGLAVLGVVIAALGHLMIAGLAAVQSRPGPIRSRIGADISFWLGVVSIVTATGGAASFLVSASGVPRQVRGVTVSTVFEFALAAAFFSLPAWALLVLRIVAFRARPATRASAHTESTLLEAAPHSRSPFRIDFFGPLLPEQISQSWTDTPRSTSPTLERAIAQVWEAESAVAQAENRILVDGALIRLVDHQRGQEGVRLVLGPTSYREFFGTHVHNAPLVAQFGSGGYSEAIGVSAVIVTRDGRLALGRRSRRVANYAEHLHTFGGMLERLAGAGRFPPHVADALAREISEELGIARLDRSRSVLLGLVRDRLLVQPELIFEVAIDLNQQELLESFGKARDGLEHVAIEFLPDDPGRVLPALNSVTKVTPIAEAAVLLHGRRAWGSTWYEQACALLYGSLPAMRPQTAAPQAETSSGDPA